MTRKDTILIAVVINAALLAILFITAVIYDSDENIEQTDKTASSANSPSTLNESSQIVLAETPVTGDEVDNVLKYYSSPASQPIVVQPVEENSAQGPVFNASNVQNAEIVSSQKPEASSQENFIEVKVKKGDALEKIARANKTTIGAIKKANNLQNVNLSIGQVLKIPLKPNPPANAKEALIPETVKGTTSEAVYHIIKSGDSPWKIAKQYHLNYEDILLLNNLDEEKARNLKIGDRIRVK